MEERGEGYPSQLYSYNGLPSLHQGTSAMAPQNPNSQSHPAPILNFVNRSYYQNTLVPNPVTMRTHHQADFWHPLNMNTNANFLIGQTPSRQYGDQFTGFDNGLYGQGQGQGQGQSQSTASRQYLYGQSSSLDHQFLSNNNTNNSSLFVDTPFPINNGYSSVSSPFQSQIFNDLESRMRGLRIDSTVRGQTAAYNPRHYQDLNLFNSSALTSGSRFNNFFHRESQFSDDFRSEYLAKPSSTRHRSIRADLLRPGRSINESAIDLPSSSSFGRARTARQHSSNTSLEVLRGRVCSVAKDQKECRFLQKKIEERNPIDIEIILMEVKDNLPELMVHQFANYLIQKLIGVLNEQQMTQLIRAVVSSEQKLFRVCDDVHGTRVMQKLLDPSEISQMQALTVEQLSILLSALKKIAVNLCKSSNGQHVIERCFQKFSNEYTKELVEEIVESCVDLATEKSGCCILQHCILHAKEEHKGRLISEIATNSLALSDHPYGNYVVQYILQMDIPQVTANILSQLAGNYFSLSLSKYASNVVEKCLNFATEEQLTAIVSEIVHHPDILVLMLNNFGNFVIQKVWEHCKGRPLGQTLYHHVQVNFPFLQSHMYGKKVLEGIMGNRRRQL